MSAAKTKTKPKKAAAKTKPAAKKKTAAAKTKPAPKTAKKAAPSQGEATSRAFMEKIMELTDWRGQLLTRIRTLIKQADPDAVEELKWRGVPVWSHDGIICTGETYRSTVKMTFAQGASLPDPKRLFNSSLEGGTRRAIDIREGEKIDEAALKNLIRAAVELNTSKKKRGKK